MKHSKISNIGNDINTLLFPRVCFGCNVRLYRGEHLLCTVCRNQIPLTEQNFTDENAVDRIFYGRCRIKKAASFLYYSDFGMVKNLIHYLKYRNQQIVGEFLGHWFGHEIARKSALRDIAYIIPVPLHRKKLRKRGYNQVSSFAKSLAIELNTVSREDILIKTVHTRTQTTKKRMFRSQFPKKLYRVEHPTCLENTRILLVDDVITTGATMEACCEAFAGIPELEIYLASMAFVP